MILIDSSAWIHCFRPEGNLEVRSKVQIALDTGDAAWCEMVKLELWNGARGAQEKKVLLEMESTLPLLASTSEVWEESYRLARVVRQKGQTIPVTDLLIFACARCNRSGMIHADHHFDWLIKNI